MGEFIFKVFYENSFETDKQVIKEFLKVRKYYLDFGYDFDCHYLTDYENFKNFDSFYDSKFLEIKNLYPNFPKLNRIDLPQDEIDKLEHSFHCPIQLLNKLPLDFQSSYFEYCGGDDYDIIVDLFFNLIKTGGIEFIFGANYQLYEAGYDSFSFGDFFYCKSFDLFVDAIVHRTWGYNLRQNSELLKKLGYEFKKGGAFQEDGSLINYENWNDENDYTYYKVRQSWLKFFKENRPEFNKCRVDVPIQKPYGYYDEKNE